MKRRARRATSGGRDGSVTIRDVARKARVSLGSVSRVLSDHPDVSRAMQQRVLKAVELLDFEPDIVAQSLRRGSTHTIGFLIGDISNPVFADVIRGAEDHARSKGYDFTVVQWIEQNQPAVHDIETFAQSGAGR